MTTDKELHYWIEELSSMYNHHNVELDHKDCKEIMDLLIEFKNKLEKDKNKYQELRKRNPYLDFDKENEYKIYLKCEGYLRACDELEKMEREE